MASLPIKYPELGARFSRLMDSKGWTITQLAAVAGSNGEGVTFATIARLRKGQTRPRQALLTRLAELLDVSEQEILGGDMPTGLKREQSSKSQPRPLIQASALPHPDSLEAKMARILVIQKQIAAADTLKPELNRLLDDVAGELNKLKSLAS